MFKLFKITCFLFALLPAFLFSQNAKKIKKAYADFDYYKVIELSEQGKIDDVEYIRELADSYKMTGNYSKAETLYQIVANANQKTNEDLYNYAQILKMNKKYKEAFKVMDLYSVLNSDDSRVELFQMHKTHFNELLVDKKQFVITNLNGNSHQQDFGVCFYKKKIVFASSRQSLGYLTHIWNGNRLPFVDMYEAKVNDKKQLRGVKKFPAFNKKFHDGPATFNAKGKYIVFSSDNYASKNKEGVRLLSLYESNYEKGEWTPKKSLPFNNDNYSCGHPALTADGNTLYFVSDMPGGYGKTDIYKSTRDEKGKWSNPVNLGDKINTEGDEMFPFIHESGLFFFASNGRPGLGGLDVFVTTMVDDFFSKPKNVGWPVNSSKDDFGMILDEEKKKGYFSSNREEGKGNDDIYVFDLLKPFAFSKVIKGNVKDKSGNFIDDAAVFLLDKKGKVLDKVCTKKNGSYVLFPDENTEFTVESKKEKYYDTTKDLNTKDSSHVVKVNLVLEDKPDFVLYTLITDAKTKQPIDKVSISVISEKAEVTSSVTSNNGVFEMALFNYKLGDSLHYIIEISKRGYVSKTLNFNWKLKTLGVQNVQEILDVNLSKVELGGDLAKMSNLGNIYFDLAKFDIREDAAKELDKIVKIMNENEDMVVELGSHTDCRSSKKYNLSLSDKRAKSSVEYIKKRIQKPNRITGKGYGESKLLNNCACEGSKLSPCSEEEHAKNRRTEFIIVKVSE